MEARDYKPTQVIAVMSGMGMCVGKLYEVWRELPAPTLGVYAQSWRGVVCGHEMRARSVNDAAMECRKLLRDNGLHACRFVRDEGHEVDA